MMDIEQALSQAELFIRQNQTSQARAMLGQILQSDPQNEEAWILSAQVSDKPQQVLYCLNQAIKINPTSSRARLLLDRLQLPQPPVTPVEPAQPPQPAQPPLAETQPHPAPLPAAAMPEQGTSYPSDIPYSGLDYYDTASEASSPEMATVSDTPLEEQAQAPKRPMRWLQRIFTIAASACLLAPWISIQNADQSSRTLSGLEVLLGPIFSPLGVDVGIAGLALLACLILPLLIFFHFRSAATQKWGERATLALVPLACVLCLDMISFYYAGLTYHVELRWGIWAAFAFYSLTGMSALINAIRLGSAGRMELSAARAGRTFTWLFSLGDLLALLVTVVGLLVMGKFSLFGIAVPSIWLLLGALLSHVV